MAEKLVCVTTQQQNTEKSLDYYKQLSTRHLTESSNLAEQLICLRSDLERQNLQMIKSRIIPNSESFGGTEESIIPQPQTIKPQPITLKAGTEVCSAETMKHKKENSVSLVKLDPPRLPYKFIHHPHNPANNEVKKEHINTN